MIDPITGCFVLTQYIDNKETTTANLIENMRFVRYPWPVEIMFDQGG